MGTRERRRTPRHPVADIADGILDHALEHAERARERIRREDPVLDRAIEERRRRCRKPTPLPS